MKNGKKSNEEWERENAEIARWQNMTDEEREVERQRMRDAKIAELKANKKEFYWQMPESELIDASPKAYKIRTKNLQRYMGKIVHVYEFLPKSCTKVTRLDNGMIEVSIPEFLYNKKSHNLYGLYNNIQSRPLHESYMSVNEANSYGWVVNESEAQKAYQLLVDTFGKEYANEQIIKTLTDHQLAESLAFIFRMNDMREWKSTHQIDDDDILA